MDSLLTRTLGKSGITVSALGMGCWAIGGPLEEDGKSGSWGTVDDRESLRAIQRAVDLGITLFDTADSYGAGHSEHLLGQALKAVRSQVVIATKFGYVYDEEKRVITGENATPAYLRQACEASLRRLESDYIDLYQLHLGSVPAGQADGAFAALEDLRKQGKIRAYGWSTDDPDAARRFAADPGFIAIQHSLNLFEDAPKMLALCAEFHLASINRSPLAMGLLSGKYTAGSRLPTDDVRGAGHGWVPFFKDGQPRPEYPQRMEAVRAILTSQGRTLVQGALAWLWARSPQTLPIPGFKTVQQVEENAGAMRFGPLAPGQMQEIERILGRAG